jgi:MFS family permease
MRIESVRQATIARLLAAFEAPSYGRLWLASCLNSSGRWIGQLGLGWLALSLTDSPFWVGLVSGLMGAGQLTFGLLAGVLVDRLDRRVTLLGVYLCNGLVMAGMAALALSGRLAPWHLLVAALANGALISVQIPAMNTIIYQMVGRERMMNASAAQTLSFNTARIVGSTLAGVLIAGYGAGWAYLAGAGAVGLSAVIILSVRGTFRSGAPQSKFWEAARAGVRYVWTRGPLRRLLYLSAVVEGFGFSHYALVPVMARDVLHAGAAGLGALSTAAGVGAFGGTFLMFALSTARHKARLLQAADAAAGLLLVLFALSPWYPASLALALLLGMALTTHDILLQTLVQLLTTDEVRGRTFGVFGLTFGFNSTGGFAGGTLAAVAGAPAAIAAGGGVILAAVLGLLRVKPAGEEET